MKLTERYKGRLPEEPWENSPWFELWWFLHDVCGWVWLLLHPSWWYDVLRLAIELECEPEVKT